MTRTVTFTTEELQAAHTAAAEYIERHRLNGDTAANRAERKLAEAIQASEAGDSREKALQRVIETEGPKWAAVRDAVKYQRFMRGDEIPESEVFYFCHECHHFTQDPTEGTSVGRCPHAGWKYDLTPPNDLFSGNESAGDCPHFEKREEHCCGTCDYFRNGKHGIDCCAAFQRFTSPENTACNQYERRKETDKLP